MNIPPRLHALAAARFEHGKRAGGVRGCGQEVHQHTRCDTRSIAIARIHQEWDGGGVDRWCSYVSWSRPVDVGQSASVSGDIKRLATWAPHEANKPPRSDGLL